VNKRMMKRAHRQAVLAAIARREWLLRVLALTAVGCGRRRPGIAQSRLTVSYPDNQVGQGAGLFTDSSSQFLVFLPLVGRNANGELEGRLARSWEHSQDYRTWTVHLRTDRNRQRSERHRMEPSSPTLS